MNKEMENKTPILKEIKPKEGKLGRRIFKSTITRKLGELPTCMNREEIYNLTAGNHGKDVRK